MLGSCVDGQGSQLWGNHQIKPGWAVWEHSITHPAHLTFSARPAVFSLPEPSEAARAGVSLLPVCPEAAAHFCSPSSLSSPDWLGLFPALLFWVISHGNDLSASSAPMPFPEPGLPDLPLMLLTENSLDAFFLHHTLLKRILLLF